MDLIPNSTFRLLPELTPSTSYQPGIYRVILDEPAISKTITVLIQSDGERKRKPGGRKRRKAEADLKRPPKKAPQPMIGSLIWMERPELLRLSDAKLLKSIQIERARRVVIENPDKVAEDRNKKEHERRVLAMAGFLDYQSLRDGILVHGGLGGLVREAVENFGVSRPFVYKHWSALCRFGINPLSLLGSRERCGAPGVRRPCDPGGRKKPGKKALKESIARAYGDTVAPDQPGMSSDWAAAIRAADNQIPSPKPSWPKRCDLIVKSSFCGKAVEVDGKFELAKPDLGTYPNDAQIQRVLTTEKSRLLRLIERTTKQHFKMARRGLIARNWRDVAGPGHQWQIDSTVGDIYLRSSVNRAWIVGRPIVYVVVDTWSTAIVGFYVCLTGPSWSTAKVCLFNAAADPSLVGEMWGYQPMLTLSPRPSLCYSLMCDRGEYLSQAHRETAMKLLPLTSYAPPYRGDLKGLVEVLHRIEKDAQFLFIPGAMDYRRAEMELRKVNPEDCVFTVREYVQYLHELFTEYNLSADRSHRVDAHMQAAGVFPSPAGLWRWGHEMGVGFRRHIPESDLIESLLPSAKGVVRRDAVSHAGCDYSSKEIEAAQWTALARNFGSWNIPVNYYPGAMGQIWTPNAGSTGLLRLQLSDQSRASPELTFEEWADCLALGTLGRSKVEHQQKMHALDSVQRIDALTSNAKRLTAEAIAKASGATPTMSEARIIELAANSHPSKSEEKVKASVQDEAMQTHQAMMDALLGAGNHVGVGDA